MRKIVIIAFLILFVALVVIFKIQNTEKNLNITANTTKIGVLLNGECLDQSYCQTHYEALEKIKNELNLEFIYRENTDKDCYNDIVNLIKRDDARIIIGVSHDFGEAMLKAADSFPNIYFLHASGTAYKKNMSSFFGRMYQARYLAGIVAGAETRTGKIGYVGAFPISEVIRGVNAFTLGVKSVRPDAKVYVRYVYSWTKAEPAKRASRQLITSRNVDVITSHTDTLQPIIEANKAGIYTIGYHFDNSHLFMDTYLTACVWNWQSYYKEQIQKCLQGKFYGTHSWLDLDKGVVSLSDYSYRVDKKTRKKVEEERKKLANFDFDVFYGPIKDNQGNLRIRKGESMTDLEMLTGFDWYVEGVTIERE